MLLLILEIILVLGIIGQIILFYQSIKTVLKWLFVQGERPKVVDVKRAIAFLVSVIVFIYVVSIPFEEDINFIPIMIISIIIGFILKFTLPKYFDE